MRPDINRERGSSSLDTTNVSTATMTTWKEGEQHKQI